MIFRVGLLLDSFEVSAWERALVERLLRMPGVHLALVVLNTGGPFSKSPWERLWRNRRGLAYYIYDRIDRAAFRQQPDAFARRDIRELLAGVPVLEVKPIRKKLSDSFPQEALEGIRAQEIDILVRMGFRFLRGEVLTVARYGIWSYHHGDNLINRGGPPGFWECMQNEWVTGSVLQILTEDLDGGTVLYRSWSGTRKLSPHKNRNNYYWKSVAFLPRMIEALDRLGPERFFARAQRLNPDPHFYDRPLYRAPTNGATLLLLARLLVKMAGRLIVRITSVYQWILLYHVGPDLTFSARRLRRIVPPRDRFWADPVMLSRDGRHFVFVEEYMYQSRKGHIAVMEIDGAKGHTTPRKVLERPYHLSYPFVFEWQGRTYMIPESFQNRAIELYECLEFPDRWEFRMNLMEGVSAADPTLLFHDGRWWMFATLQEYEGASHDDELFLFYADTLLTQNWTPHPENPVISDVRRARAAGRIFMKDGRLLRPSQDCSRSYGYGLNLQEIVTLTPTEYEERTLGTIRPHWDPRIEGVHSLAHDDGLTVLDAHVRGRRFRPGSAKSPPRPP